MEEVQKGYLTTDKAAEAARAAIVVLGNASRQVAKREQKGGDQMLIWLLREQPGFLLWPSPGQLLRSEMLTPVSAEQTTAELGKENYSGSFTARNSRTVLSLIIIPNTVTYTLYLQTSHCPLRLERRRSWPSNL